ncbi:MAG: PadR family transcriptional regulator [Holophagales bacterium]|nr:PadR family transcriptional regulator [Holophagales bacterium]
MKELPTTPKAAKELLRGTLDSLVLKTLSWGPLHGYGIARWLEQRTDDEISIEEGSLYPALYRLEGRGWLSSEWGTSELGRRAKYYRLTDDGRAQLARETEAWRAFSRAVSRVLLAEAAPEAISEATP